MEVGDRQSAQFLDDRTLTLAEERLVFFVVKAEVANQEDGLVEKLLGILLAVSCLSRVVQNEAK